MQMRLGIYDSVQPLHPRVESTDKSPRLNLQHFMYKDAQKFLLHPIIQIDLRHKQETKQAEDQSVLNVADLATGTG